ncbi:MAG TPA: putative quinol monooxygenase [Sedimentibacter sp.]|jgi:quinol monooxygenase YgiN|nr:antibiotic biosynthesis monooxygenase [Tissierellia bacterium]HOA20312.1 putative quinol monooxygenase [Sedimentibacter sp.]HOG62753.1 putative quinol monooxygenase [Sedimentibacter sp.]HOT21664.1 putative quinol monooxygenase [Sedimentibacter sp.]HPV85846.1 putative quinol monooxygenase [Sedimentibacter sp.]
MIKVVAKGYFLEGKAEEAIKLYEELVEKTRKEEGCISYSLFRDIEDDSILTMIEEWESKDALDKHFKTEHFTKLVPMIGKLRKSSEVNIYKLVI